MAALYLVVFALSSPARADGTLTTSVNVGYEPSASPAFGGHGWGLVRVDRDGLLPRGARLSFEYNTDTIRLTIDRARFDRLELGVQATGEAILAGVLTDYWKDGRDYGARSFAASYVDLTGGAKVDLGPHYVEFTAGARRWIFHRWTQTEHGFHLPPEAFVGELRFRYTFWHILPDPSMWQPQRPFGRVRGIAAGAEASVDFRSAASRWGALGDPQPDVRNDPSPTVYGLHQWARAGVQVHPRVRLQAREQLDFLWGADDLDRVRVGGMNPYVVPLAGAPWPAYLADRLVSAEGSLHVKVHGEQEIGVLADVVGMPDVRRVGAGGTWHALAGIGAFCDLRIKSFQIDVRTGWSPTVQPGSNRGGFTFLAAVGWGSAKKK